MNFKERITSLIKAYQNSSLKSIVESKIISAKDKMIFRSLGKITQKTMEYVTRFREKYENEEDSDKKARYKIYVQLAAAFLGHLGNVLIEAKKVLLNE